MPVASLLHRGVWDTPQLTHCLEWECEWEDSGEEELGLEAVEDVDREEFMEEEGGEAEEDRWL